MTIEEMRERKRELGYSYKQIADLAGLKLGTVQKALGGFTKAPRYETIQALEKVLRKKPDPVDADMIGETAVSYGVRKKGEYTYEDYLSLPEDRRTELIDGTFYDMGAPSVVHQRVVRELVNKFIRCIEKSGRNCELLYAPVDVRLDKDDKTCLQPDIMVICREGIIEDTQVFGAPDLVVEVLSRSTARIDMGLKMTKYMKAGVREYWIVDPDRKLVITYDFAANYAIRVFGEKDRVPVMISEGKCDIEISEVWKGARL